MTKAPVADYTPNAIGRRFPKCGTHGVHTVRAVRAAPEGAGGWGLLCPGPSEGQPHVIPVREPREPDRFPPCRLCGTRPTGLRPNYREDEEYRLLVSFTLVGCGHTIAVSWPVALGLV